MLQKLTSRKFLLALISVITGIMGMLNYSDSIIQLVSSVGLALIPTIVYIITEGSIGLKSLGNVADTISDALKEAENIQAQDTALPGNATPSDTDSDAKENDNAN